MTYLCWRNNMQEPTKEQKAKVIFDMLKDFKSKHNQLNTSLRISGDEKFTSPFETLQVQDIKEYAMKFIIEEELVDL